MGTRRTRVALVTGGAQGIGKAISLRLLKEGWSVALADTDAEAGLETEAACRPRNRAWFVPTDVSDEASVVACVRRVVRRWGRLDAVISNAGIGGPYTTPLDRVPREQWDHIIAVNLTGAFLLAKHTARFLRKTRGAIILIASTRALQSEPHTEAYAASKGGLVALTHSLAVSLGPAVRVNCISPGWIDVTGWKKRTQRKPAILKPADHAQHPVGRVGIPDDIAAAVAFLVSTGAGFITGQNFVVDGGMTRKMIYVE